MTEAESARFLIEELPAKIRRALREDTMLHGASADSDPNHSAGNEKVAAVANRIALQVFSVPSLQSFLADYNVLSTGRSDGSVKIQMDFLKLPKEIVPELEKLLSVDDFKDHRLVKYIKNGQARTGLEIEVTPKDLPGTAYDYSY